MHAHDPLRNFAQCFRLVDKINQTGNVCAIYEHGLVKRKFFAITKAIDDKDANSNVHKR